ncbi:hypothetical protein ES703_49825 [subsurface metagenome]
MSETLEFRRINEIEEKIIITSLTKISSEFQQIINDIKKFLYFSTESLTSRSKRVAEKVQYSFFKNYYGTNY